MISTEEQGGSSSTHSSPKRGISNSSRLQALCCFALVAWAFYLAWHSAHFFPWKFSFLKFFDLGRFAPRPASEWIFHWLTTARHLVVLVVWVVSSFGSGIWALHTIFKVRARSRLEEALYAIGLGFSFWMLLIFLLGVVGAWNRMLFQGIWLCLSGVGIWRTWLEREKLAPGRGWILGSRPKASDLALAAIVGALLLVVCLSANSPEVFFDALEFHLAAPSQWIIRGGMVPMPTNYFSNLPMNVQMLYTGCLMLGDERLCRMLHVVLGFSGGLVVFAIGRRLFGRRSGWWGFGIYLATPLLALSISQCGIDGASTFFALLAFLALLDWFFPPQHSETTTPPASVNRQAALAGWFLGVALGCKNTAAILLFPAYVSGILISLLQRRLRLPTFRSFLITGGIALGLLVPWLIKNTVITGNPIFPMLFRVIPTRYIDAIKMDTQMTGLREFGARTWSNLARLPWDLTFKEPSNNSFVGVVFLCLAPGLLALAWINRRGPPEVQFLLITLFLGGSIWAGLTQITRYLLPVLGILSVLCGSVLAQVDKIRYAGRLLRWSVVLQIGICTGALLNIIGIYQDPAGVALGFEDPTAYFNRKLMNDYTPTAGIVNQLPGVVHILAVGETRAYYFNKPVTAPTVFDTDPFIRNLDQSASGEEAWRRFREQGYTHIFMNYKEAARIRKYEPYTWNEGSLHRLSEIEAHYLLPVWSSSTQALFEIAARPNLQKPEKTGRPLFTFDRDVVRKVNEHMGRSTQAYTAGDLAHAAGELQLCIRLAPEWVPPYLQLGSLNYKLNRGDAALVLFRKANELTTLDPASLNNLGILEMRYGSPQNALAAFRSALAQSPDFEEARRNLNAAEKILKENPESNVNEN